MNAMTALLIVGSRFVETGVAIQKYRDESAEVSALVVYTKQIVIELCAGPRTAITDKGVLRQIGVR